MPEDGQRPLLPAHSGLMDDPNSRGDGSPCGENGRRAPIPAFPGKQMSLSSPRSTFPPSADGMCLWIASMNGGDGLRSTGVEVGGLEQDLHLEEDSILCL